VEHNKPYGIFTQNIFDHIMVGSKTGNRSGGMGKVHLYTGGFNVMNELLKFTSKPFTTLIRGLYLLFSSLHDYCCAKDRGKKPDGSDVRNVGKLDGCVGVVALFEEALRSEEWPTECDKVPDQYLPTQRLGPGRRESVALSNFGKSLVQEPPNGKRKRETKSEVGHFCGDKRTKVDQPQ